jgi:putative ABC transport system permease protein
MLRATVKGLLAHELRLALSAVAGVLGVAFVAGSFVFTDTTDATFTELFEETGSDVTVSPAAAFDATADVGADGEVVVTQGAPGLGVDWVAGDSSVLALVEGRRPERAGEVALDETTAEQGGLAVGDQVDLVLPRGAPVEAEVVRTLRFAPPATSPARR